MAQIARAKYNQIKSRLIERGVTLRSWALQHHFPVGSVYNAAKGLRRGVRATRIRKQLERFLNE